METLARLLGPFRRAPLDVKQPSEPEMLSKSRPMTSFFDSLSAEQKAKLRAYRGPENHGSDQFRRVQSA